MRFVCLISAVVVALQGSSFADDWAFWRGPEHTGTSRETGLVESWDLATKKNVLWESPIGGRATPVVIDGRIYLHCP